jgi:alpha-L-fucosidase
MNLTRFTTLGALAIAGISGGHAQNTAATPPPAPYGATPTSAQVKQAERAFYGFCHFTVDTFTDREWGLGTESETIFNPTEFDANQIVGALKAGGATGVILTCKHHDGFCLWPSATTEHDVANSPFRGGKGDVVKEFADACKTAGVGFGTYLSPWDRNHPTYGKPEYITVYRDQLRELLTNYGPVFEIWMDGANGGTGYYRGKVGPEEFKGALEDRRIDKATYYDWPNTWALMKQLQPQAVLFSDVGPDMRWCGNEGGHSPDTVWATITYEAGHTPGTNIPHLSTGTRNGKQWVMSEVDVSIRPGWFWHASQNGQVRSPENLMNIYMNSVGHGCTFLLNAPPDRRGLLHENDVASLKQFGEHLRQTFATNLAAEATLTASNIRGKDLRYSPTNLIDSEPWSAWITDDALTTPEVTIELKNATPFNLIKLREDIRLGQRVEGVAVDAWVDGQWKEIAKAESIGACRLWRVPQTTATRLRVRVTKSPVCPALSDFGLYLEPEIGPWIPPIGGNREAAKKASWKVHSVSFAPPSGAAKRAIDGDPATLWHTHGDDGERKLPQEIAVDLGSSKNLTGFTYTPRQDNTRHGMVDQYAFYLSANGTDWKLAAEGEFGNLRANPVEQTVTFPATQARYFKFVAKHALELNHAAIAELGVVESVKP